jgi:hypothetical protein
MGILPLLVAQSNSRLMTVRPAIAFASAGESLMFFLGFIFVARSARLD